MTYSIYLNAAIELAKEAGGFLKRFRDGGDLKIEEKGSDLDFVTNADKTSQSMICGRIKELFPSHGFIGEEDGLTCEEIESRLNSGNDDYYWVVDPLDGTLNYIRGLGNYSVSIGLVKGGKPIVGVVYCPAEDELFSSEKGIGAYLNGRRIYASKRTRLHDSLVIQAVPPTDMRLREKMRELNERLSAITLNSRMLGSAAREISCVALGGAEAYFEYGIHPWDVAAGIVIASEAGAIVTGLNGEPYDLWNPGIMVAAGGVHKAMIEAIDYKP